MKRLRYFFIAAPGEGPAMRDAVNDVINRRLSATWFEKMFNRGTHDTRDDFLTASVVETVDEYSQIVSNARTSYNARRRKYPNPRRVRPPSGWVNTTIKVPASPEFSEFRRCLRRRGTSFSEVVRLLIAAVAGVDPSVLGVALARRVAEAVEACLDESGLRGARAET